MEAQVTITLTQEEVSLLHTALCDYRGKIGNLAAQIASAGLDSTEADALWNRLGSLSRRLAAQIGDCRTVPKSRGGTQPARHHVPHPLHPPHTRLWNPIRGAVAHRLGWGLGSLQAFRRAGQRRPVRRNRAGRAQLGRRHRTEPCPAHTRRAVQLLNRPA